MTSSRILVAIPHYFARGGESGDGRAHGSISQDSFPRVLALTRTIEALHQLFGPAQVMVQIASREALPANTRTSGTLDVVVCTTGDRHVLSEVPLPAGAFQHRSTTAAPPLLGYECHALLRERLGAYDYYGFLEDDLIVHDPWFFRKLAWFNGIVGDEALLQPNRYEVGPLGLAHKAYVDGDLLPQSTAAFQDLNDQPVLDARIMETAVTLRRPLNPHSGCFFLNNRQMRTWSSRPDFLDRSDAFVGPLESAATLGVMRAFRIYKPAIDCANFLEIEHFGSAILGQLRKRTE